MGEVQILEIKVDSDEIKYEFFEVTADVGFRAYGKSLENAFENAALAMFEVITDTSKVLPLVEKKIQLKAEDKFAILYDWLSELLFIHDSEFLVFSKFEVKIHVNTVNSKEEYSLEASICGDELDRSKHEIRSDVKAVTFHMMKIYFDTRYVVQVILDT